MFVTCPCTVTFSPSGSRIVHTVDLPAGLRCTPITAGAAAGGYFLDQFPPDLFPAGSLIRHDAEHYGVRLTAAQVKPVA